MQIKNFWYSYKNILNNTLQKNIFKFSTRILGILYKFLIRYFRHNFSPKVINLDKLEKKNFENLDLNILFNKFNCDKGTFFYIDKLILFV